MYFDLLYTMECTLSAVYVLDNKRYKLDTTSWLYSMLSTLADIQTDGRTD